MEVSVVIPAYNCAAFLERAVISALEQPQVKEVIIVEDGSTDGTLDVCKALQARFNRTRILRHPEGVNLGASESRNLGIRSAKSQFIAFLDADDEYLGGRFTVDEQVFHDHADAQGVYGATLSRFVNEDERLRFKERFHDELTTVYKLITPEDLFRGLSGWSKGVGGFHLNALTVKRETLMGLDGLFKVDLRLHQDTDLVLRLAASARLYPGSTTHPIAQRWVHGMNRILSSSVDGTSRELLYRHLFRWSVKANVAKDLQRWFRANQLVAHLSTRSSQEGWLFAWYIVLFHCRMLRWESLRTAVIRRLFGNDSYLTKGLLDLTWRGDMGSGRP